jgi:rhodanese-related sulfurtransferase
MEYILLGILFILFIIILMIFTRKKGGAMITAAEAREKILNSRPVILDVRSAKEYATGHLEEAKLIPVSELGGRLDELSDLKNQEIIVYCHSGNRSRTAAAILAKNGFSRIFDLQGGITEWTRTGNKIVIEH